MNTTLSGIDTTFDCKLPCCHFDYVLGPTPGNVAHWLATDEGSARPSQFRMYRVCKACLRVRSRLCFVHVFGCAGDHFCEPRLWSVRHAQVRCPATRKKSSRLAQGPSVVACRVSAALFAGVLCGVSVCGGWPGRPRILSVSVAGGCCLSGVPVLAGSVVAWFVVLLHLLVARLRSTLGTVARVKLDGGCWCPSFGLNTAPPTRGTAL